jgi:hypothetical protein
LLVFCLASSGDRGYGTGSADILEDVGRKDDEGVRRRVVYPTVADNYFASKTGSLNLSPVYATG